MRFQGHRPDEVARYRWLVSAEFEPASTPKPARPDDDLKYSLLALVGRDMPGIADAGIDMSKARAWTS